MLRARSTRTRTRYSSDSLASEIDALRQHYLSSGGTNPTVINQLSAALAEAQAAEKPKVATYWRREQDDRWKEYLHTLEAENARLKKQIAEQAAFQRGMEHYIHRLVHTHTHI